MDAKKAVPEGLKKAFVTLVSNGGRHSIIMKFNQSADAFEVHDYLLGVGGKEYNGAAQPVQQPAPVACKSCRDTGTVEVENPETMALEDWPCQHAPVAAPVDVPAASVHPELAPEYKEITDHNGRITGYVLSNADKMPSYSQPDSGRDAVRVWDGKSAYAAYLQTQGKPWKCGSWDELSEGSKAGMEKMAAFINAHNQSSIPNDEFTWESKADHGYIAQPYPTLNPSKAEQIRDIANRAMGADTVAFMRDAVKQIHILMNTPDAPGDSGRDAALVEIASQLETGAAGSQLDMRRLLVDSARRLSDLAAAKKGPTT